MTDHTALIKKMHSIAGMVSQSFIDEIVVALEAKPVDCRTCAEFSNANGPFCCYPTDECDSGKYKALPIVQLYRKE